MIEDPSHKARMQADEMILILRHKDNVPNIAGMIAMNVVSLGVLLRNSHGKE
jgi:hypothetical protein